MSLSCFIGKKLKFKKKEGHVKIDYKYGSIMGMGGDKSCGYNLCEYDLEGMGPVNLWWFRWTFLLRTTGAPMTRPSIKTSSNMAWTTGFSSSWTMENKKDMESTNGDLPRQQEGSQLYKSLPLPPTKRYRPSWNKKDYPSILAGLQAIL